MILSDFHLKIINAEICPYCNSKTKIVSETDIYGFEYKGNKIICCENYPKCDSYVGCHSDGKTLGRLANKDLRLAKKDAHYWFDKIWKEKHIERSNLYKMLSEYLQIPKEYTHIGMFKKETCLDVKIWAKNTYINLQNQN